MAFCSKCGTQVAEGTKFCPNCGNDVSGTPNAGQVNINKGNSYQGNMNQPNMNQGNMNQNNYGQQMNKNSAPAFMNTLDTTAQYHPQDIQDNKAMGVLSYIGLLWLVPMFAAKQSPFARFHVKQGFLVVCTQMVFEILSLILTLAIKTPVKALGYTIGYTTPGILIFILWIIRLAIWAMAVLGIVNAAQGKAKELPFIGKTASNLTFLN